MHTYSHQQIGKTVHIQPKGSSDCTYLVLSKNMCLLHKSQCILFLFLFFFFFFCTGGWLVTCRAEFANVMHARLLGCEGDQKITSEPEARCNQVVMIISFESPQGACMHAAESAQACMTQMTSFPEFISHSGDSFV